MSTGAPTTTMARVRNWDVAVALMARNLVGRPFVWGETDCGTLCRLTLDALYGPGTAEGWLGQAWKSARGAARAWRRLGGPEDVLERLGAAEVHPDYASTGDIVVLPGQDPEGLPSLAVIVGPKCVRANRELGVVAEPAGVLRRAPTTRGIQVWRLPPVTPVAAPGSES